MRLAEDTLVRMLERARVPGLAVATVHDAAVEWCGTFGVKRADTAEPVTADTRFQAASLSKPVFAYATLQLVERGQLDLDRPLAAYVGTSFAPGDPLIDRITARQVLSHTTGWPNWRPEGQNLQRECAPGTRFGYSGEGYSYLQQAVEHITGRALQEQMRESIFAPLGMGQSSFIWASPEDKTLAESHDAEGNRRPRYIGDQALAAASLHTTATDFIQFLAGLFARDNAEWRLSKASLTEIFRPQIAVSAGVSWGLGWGLEDTPTGPTFWHWGDNAGYKNFAAGSLDQQRAIVILTNGDSGARIWGPLLRMILGTTHPALDWLATRFGYPTTGECTLDELA